MAKKFDNSFKVNEEQLAALKQIIPEAFKDGFVDIGALSDALSDYSGEYVLDIDENLFGLYWPGKRAAKRAVAVPPLGTLVPVPGDGVDEETTRNIYIEGDNLEVLKIIKKAYANQIKMIYIDPPYNTGNDFIYKDDFSETEESYKRRTGQIDESGNKTTTNSKSDGRFHSKWCSMMYPRLRLARDLLSDDGVILINMDENEITHLQMVCDEIFGTENNLGTIIWDKRNPKGSVKGISYQHEHILVYSKNALVFSENCKILRPKKNAPMMLNKAEQLFNKINTSYTFEQANHDYSKWVSMQKEFTGGEKAYNSFDRDGNVFRPVSMAAPDKPETRSHRPLIHPVTNKPCPVPAKGWRFPDKSMDELLVNGEIIFGIDETTQPCRKYHLKDNMYEQIPSLLYYGGSDTDLLSSLGIPFDTPKVVNIVKEHILSFTKQGDIILDFFSGSSTTAHTVMQLNIELLPPPPVFSATDNAHSGRKFIMVQLPEICKKGSEAEKAGFKNICEIGKERIRRAGKKIKEEAGLNTANLDTGFKVFRLAPSSIKPAKPYTGTNIKELTDLFSGDPLVDGWKTENLVTEVMLKEGFPLDSVITRQDTYKKNKVFQVSSDSCDHSLVICFDKNIESDTVEKMKLGELDIFICLDSAITDQVKARLDDKGRIVTI